MATTPLMNLNLPTPTVTLGPAWAGMLNDALELIDAHNHSNGKGAKITPNGLNINADLSIQSNNLSLVRSVRLTDNQSSLSAPEDIRSVYSVGGNLYYNNASGTAVQITNGASLAAAPAGASVNYGLVQTTSSIFNINPPDQFSFINAITALSAVTVNLPAANAVAAGRFYFIKDASGNAASNPITIVPNGSNTVDGSLGNVVISQSLAAVQLISDGSTNWSVYRVPAVVNTYQTQSIAANHTIQASDSYVYLFVDTTSARTIGLPQASAVGPGRYYIIKDTSGLANSNNITVTPYVGDSIEGLATNKVFQSNWGSWMLVSNGVDGWYIS